MLMKPLIKSVTFLLGYSRTEDQQNPIQAWMKTTTIKHLTELQESRTEILVCSRQ